MLPEPTHTLTVLIDEKRHRLTSPTAPTCAGPCSTPGVRKRKAAGQNGRAWKGDNALRFALERFNQSKHSTVSDTTRRALIVGEGLHAGAATDVAALLDTLEVELRGAGFTPSRRAILTAEAPRWEGDGRQ
jgi:hypothetical protein